MATAAPRAAAVAAAADAGDFDEQTGEGQLATTTERKVRLYVQQLEAAARPRAGARTAPAAPTAHGAQQAKKKAQRHVDLELSSTEQYVQKPEAAGAHTSITAADPPQLHSARTVSSYIHPVRN